MKSAVSKDVPGKTELWAILLLTSCPNSLTLIFSPFFFHIPPFLKHWGEIQMVSLSIWIKKSRKNSLTLILGFISLGQRLLINSFIWQFKLAWELSSAWESTWWTQNLQCELKIKHRRGIVERKPELERHHYYMSIGFEYDSLWWDSSNYYQALFSGLWLYKSFSFS